MRSRLGGGLAVLAALCVIASGLTVAAGGYSLSSPDATSIPERTEEIQGTEFTVDAHVAADPGDSITVESTAPDDGSYQLYLYNSDGDQVDRHGVTGGDATVDFDLSGTEPGSYAVGTYVDGEIMAVLPVLVRGYDVSASAPGQVTTGESFDVSIDVTPTAASGDPAGVSAVFVTEDGETTVEATGSDGSYTASVSAGELSEGEYTVYGAVQGGDDSVEGEEELMGIDEAGTLTVEEQTETETPTDTQTATPTETESNGGSGGSGGGGGGGGGGGSGAAPADEATDTDSDGETETSGAETATDDGSPTETETATATEQGDETEAGAEGAITPGNDSTATAETAGSDGPGFGVAVGLVAILGLAILASRRRA